MKIAIASDHAGFELKREILDFLLSENYQVADLGTDSSRPVDYPDYALKVGAMVQKGAVDRGILICGSGVGVCVAANRIPGVRAGICHDTYSAHQGVEHDKMNVLVLGSRVIGSRLARELVLTFLAASFSGEKRHLRRLQKIEEIERTYCKKSVPE